MGTPDAGVWSQHAGSECRPSELERKPIAPVDKTATCAVYGAGTN